MSARARFDPRLSLFTPAARRYLAAALGHLGRLDEARVVIADLLKAQPNSNLRSSRSIVFRDPRMSELYISGLEKAGPPE